MNKIALSFLALLCCINIQAGVKLQKQGSATQLVVNEKTMLLLARELAECARVCWRRVIAEGCAYL